MPRATIVVFLALLAFAQAVWARNEALLVGVSAYPTLSKSRQLEGPRNDVALIRTLLEARNFRPQDIHVIADQVPGARALPTRTAILAELLALSERVTRGDFVFVYFAGHGAQQPAVAGPTNPEPDSKDEIFLPRDVGQWSAVNKSVRNAITDNELGAAIDRIRHTGAFVWAVFDTCHSGSLDRLSARQDFRYRSVAPEELSIPIAGFGRVPSADSRLPPRPGRLSQTPGTESREGSSGGLVAFYAAQPWERSPEYAIPSNAGARDKRRQVHGMFTHALAEMIASGRAMTYRQAGQLLLQTYRASAVTDPTPLFDGNRLDAPLFGASDQARAWQWPVARLDGESWIPAGQLHQLGEGSIFALHRNPAPKDDEIVGYATADRVEFLRTRLKPTAHLGRPAIDFSTLGPLPHARLVARKRALYVTFALPEYRKDFSRSEHTVYRLLQELARSNITGFARFRPRGHAADVHLGLGENRLWMHAKLTTPDVGGVVPSPSIPLEASSTDRQHSQVLTHLDLAARSIGLLKASATAGGGDIRSGLILEVGIERATRTDTNPALNAAHCQRVHYGNPQMLRPERIANLRACDRLTIRIRNDHPFPVDVTLFHINGAYGLTSLYPSATAMTDNRIPGGGAVAIPAQVVTDDSAGRESLLLIGLEALPGREISDLRFVADPAQDRARSIEMFRNPAGPLGYLGSGTVYRSISRGRESANTRSDELRWGTQLISWDSAPGRSQ